MNGVTNYARETGYQNDFLRTLSAKPEINALRHPPGDRATLADARRALRLVFGHSEFREAQERALEAILAGRDVLAVFPTGGGKSLCYQIPAILLSGLTIVVSPLISLMKDQIDGLRELGVPARYLNSSLRVEEVDQVIAELRRDELRLLYVSPERFESDEFKRLIASSSVALLAIDEAHCVSEWGHDFRPAYKRLGACRSLFPDAPVIAVTATATPSVRRDIVDQLALRNPSVQVGGFDRQNLHWTVVPTADETAKLAATLRALRGLRGSAIVYVSTQDGACDVARTLTDAGHPAQPYHGGLSAARRKSVQDAFMEGEPRIVVATNAFGMGIDKSDIRLVLHYTIPATMEALYQEAGRGGRDGAPARSVLLYAPADRGIHEHLIQQKYPTRAFVERVYRALCDVSDADGLHPDPAMAIKAALALSSVRPIDPALKVLTEAGVIRYTTSRRQALHLTLKVPADGLRERLPEHGCEEDLRLLRTLWKCMGGEALYGGATLRGQALSVLPGGSAAAARTLERLEAMGIVSWSMEQIGTALLHQPRTDTALPVDWAALDRGRKLDLSKLDAVQAYATGRGCRRHALLKYFHDTTLVSCSGCDQCDRETRYRPAERR